MKKRYVLDYCPKDVVAKLAQKYAKEIEEGSSLWDCVDPSSLERSVVATTEAQALKHAIKLVPQDEYGEVRVYEQIEEVIEGTTLSDWETVRMAVVYDAAKTLEFHPYR